MYILYSFNMFFSLCIFFLMPYFAVKYLHHNWFNPFSILALGEFPVFLMKTFFGPAFLIDGGVLNPYFQFALFVSNIQLGLQFVSFLVFFLIIRNRTVSVPLSSVPYSFVQLKWFCVFFFSLYLLSFVWLAGSSELGLMGWLGNPRLGYQQFRSGQGMWYAFAVAFLSLSYTFFCLYTNKISNLIRGSFFYFVLIYFLGSKGFLLNFVFFMMICLWFRKWKHLNKIITIGLPVVFSVMLFNLYLALGDLNYEDILSYFDYFKNATDYFKEYFSGRVGLFNGEILLSSFWGYAPRNLFPEKPIVYGILLVNEIFFPGQAELTNTPAYSAGVEYFADFGLAGVTVFSLFSLTALFKAIVVSVAFKDKSVGTCSMSYFSMLAYIILFSPAFGSFFPGGAFFMLFICIMFLLFMVKQWRYLLLSSVR